MKTSTFLIPKDDLCELFQQKSTERFFSVHSSPSKENHSFSRRCPSFSTPSSASTRNTGAYRNRYLGQTSNSS